MRFFVAPTFVLATWLALAGPLPGQTTIVARTQADVGSFFSSVNYASWTQTGAFSGVTIKANLFSAGGTASGTAFLTTQIGPGTTTGQQIATTAITLSNTTPAPFTLFSGLTLGPGTYYVTIQNLSSLDWQCCGTVTTTTAPGVTANNDAQFSVLNPFAPASTFFNKGQNLIFSAVAGAAGAATVPTLSPIAAGMAALLLLTSGLFLLKRYQTQE